MSYPRTLPAFSDDEYKHVHRLLASRVAAMMGRKLEERDWSEVYHAAKGIPYGGWSNLNIDVICGSLGVEHKMLCVKADRSIREYCGMSRMHPAMTRSIRIPSLDADPTPAARDVLRQYAELIEQRRRKVSENHPGVPPDMRTGWLLWQETLIEFLYFEEEMLPPDPDCYWAEWKESGGGARKTSRNLWVYEVATGRKRYSITTAAGAKIQAYFDVPPPNDPNLYYFRVQGEEMSTNLVRVWITSSTALLLKQLLGNLDTETVSSAITRIVASLAPSAEGLEKSQITRRISAEPMLLTMDAYRALKLAFTGVSDEHMIQLFVGSLSKSRV